MRTVTVAVLAGLSFLPIASAHAQDYPNIEVSTGFSSLGTGACCLPTTGSTPIGWQGGAAVGLSKWLSIVGELGGDYAKIQPLAGPLAPALLASKIRTFGLFGGPRVTLNLTRTTRVFGQMLLGGTSRRGEFVGTELHGTTSHFAWQPGGGIDIGIADQWAIRLEGDYRLTPMDGLVAPQNHFAQPRFASGIVFRP